MQTFDELALELLAVGYRLVAWVEIECGEHGAFRGTVAWDGQTLCCPRCQRAAEASFLARGLTRDAEFPWRCVSPALPQASKTDERAEAAMQRGARVMDRKRCQKFFDRARRELAGIT